MQTGVPYKMPKGAKWRFRPPYAITHNDGQTDSFLGEIGRFDLWQDNEQWPRNRADADDPTLMKLYIVCAPDAAFIGRYNFTCGWVDLDHNICWRDMDLEPTPYEMSLAYQLIEPRLEGNQND